MSWERGLGGGYGSDRRQQVQARAQDRERLLRRDLPRFGPDLYSPVVRLTWYSGSDELCCSLSPATHVDTYEIVAVKIVSTSPLSPPPPLSFDFVGIRLGFSGLRCHRLRDAIGSLVELDNYVVRIRHLDTRSCVFCRFACGLLCMPVQLDF